MRRWLIGIFLLLLVLATGWGAFGWNVYSRNRVPPIQLPAIASPPASNVYPQLLQLTKQVQETALLLEMESQPDMGSYEQKNRVVQANREVLHQLRQLADAPSQVTHLGAQVDDPAMEHYQNVARLAVAHARLLDQSGQSERALDAYLDGLAYAEQAMRGGNTLHLTFNFMSSVIIFQHVPTLIPKLSAQDASRGAQRLKKLLEREYPLHELFTQEFREQLTGWERSIKGMAVRGFRLDLPKSPVESAMLYRPKAPIIQAALQYANQCIENAKLPYPKQSVIPLPPVLESLPEGMRVVRTPEEIALHAARYFYVRTRLRLVYTALRLEAFRKTTGRYPARLSELGDSPYFTDPFSGEPFVYRPLGNAYVLYSVGPNGIDDGGTPFPEGRLHRGQPGDIGLVPNFPRTP